MNDLPERAFRFHYKPRGGCDEPCPLCGLPGTRRGFHRAIRPEEAIQATHILMRANGVRVPVGCPGGPKPKPREALDLPKGHRMVSTAVRERIGRAARLHAAGETFDEIARKLHVNVASVYSWKSTYAKLWRFDFRRALAKLNEAMEAEPIPEPESTPPPDGSMSLADFLFQVYLPAKLDVSAEWGHQLEVTIRQLDKWAGRKVGVGDLSEPFIRRFLADFHARHAPATTNGKRRHLLALWRLAHREELLDHGPCASRIPLIKDPGPDVQAWTAEEVSRIIVSARMELGQICGIPSRDWWVSFLMVCYDCGSRRGETLAVAPRDLDLDAALVCFRRTKTKKVKWAPLSADTVNAIRRIWDPLRAKVWSWVHTTNYLEKRIKAILKRANVPHGAGHGGLFHKMRKTSGTFVDVAGFDGSKHLGNTRAVFERHYRDPRFVDRRSLEALPRPTQLLLTHETDDGGDGPA